jgi:hypothetical protein
MTHQVLGTGYGTGTAQKGNGDTHAIRLRVVAMALLCTSGISCAPHLLLSVNYFN